MVGADLAAPMDLSEWKREVDRWLADLLAGQEVQVELAYASFASLGRAAQKCAALAPEWGGGAFAQVVTGGVVRVGDPITWET